MNIKVYQLKFNLPYTNFKKGDLFLFNEQGIMYNNAILPKMMSDFILDNKSHLVQISLIGNINDYVIIDGDNSQLYKIIDIKITDNNDILYKVKGRDDLIKYRFHSNSLIIKFNHYYYISDSGEVKCDGCSNNIQATEFRIKTNNVFILRKLAEQKLLELKK